MCSDSNRCIDRCLTKLDICSSDPDGKWPTRIPPSKPKRTVIDHSGENDDGSQGDDNPNDGYTGAG